MAKGQSRSKAASGAGQGRREIEHISSRFLALRDIRLRRLRELLPARRQEVLDLLPLLFHLNHPSLPGYTDDDAPCGLPAYQLSDETAQAARKYLRQESLKARAQYVFVLRGLYLMGSLGTLGQDRDSDFDVWLCHDPGLDLEARERLEAKAAAVEAWARAQGTELHIFLVDAEDFRRGHKTALSDESSGSTQHFLLLEEFYRTGLLLGGRPPLWWLVPPDEEHAYDAWVERLVATQGLQRDEWIDFGPLAGVPADEFFSSAHWQLHKGIDAPYKSILKLMLIETYTAEYPHIGWLSEQLKRAVYGKQDLDPDQLDPYRMIMVRLTEHLTARGAADRLELARRSLYIKSGVRLSDEPSKPDWRYPQLRELSKDWGWSRPQWAVLDRRQHWQLEQVMEERDALVAELSNCYQMLTEFARANGSNMNRNGLELSLLGRKLYAALERRPGKVDLITPGISRDLQQQQLWISRHSDGADGGHWRLYRNPPVGQPDAFPPIRASGSLVEMLAWLYINKLANSGSQIQLLPRDQNSVFPEHQRILQTLEKRLGEPSTRPQPLTAFVDTPHALQSLAFLNVAAPPGEADDAASAVMTVDHLLVTSWGEILVRTLDHGLPAVLDTLCNHLTMSSKNLGDRPPPLYSHCFSSGAADAVARGITALSVDIADCFRQQGDRSRYVFKLEGSCYLVERAEDEFHWLTIGDDERLLQFLQEPQARFRPVKLDPRILQGSPLVRIYEENIEGVVQVFYRLDIEGVDMYVLDDMGALFHQHYPSISEYNFLSQQQRLFDSLANRRLLTMANQAGQVLAGETLFYRLGQSPKGWIAEQVARPAKLPRDELELVLVTSREGLSNDNFMLLADNREFDALRLGPDLYREVARHVLERRHTGLDYPVRLTGVMPAGLEQGACWTVHEMLTSKRRIEQRLTRALRSLQVLQAS